MAGEDRLENESAFFFLKKSVILFLATVKSHEVTFSMGSGGGMLQNGRKHPAKCLQHLLHAALVA
jgi:hypothetical protein